MRVSLMMVLGLLAGPVMAQNLEEGAAAFEAHCAGCHGLEARGDGPMAALLRVQPADLTALSAGNGGVFPLARVIRRVDGTADMLAHGGPMPVFGVLLQGPSVAVLAPDGGEVVAAEAIANIAAWLEGLQE